MCEAFVKSGCAERECKVSVIVPVYNAEKYLSACLDSLIAQVYEKYEILLVDDGSSDASPSICDEYAARFPNVFVCHQENRGVSSARNTGLSNAKGKWIAFVDSDDVVSPYYIEKLLLEAESNTDIDLVVQGVTIFSNRSGAGDHFVLKDCVYSSNQLGKCLVENNLLEFGYPVSKMFRRDLLKRNGIKFNTTIKRSEDLLFFLQVLLKCRYVRLVSGSNYHYNAFHSSLSIQKFSSENEWRLFKELYRIFFEPGASFGRSCLPYAQKYISRILMQSILALYVENPGHSSGFRSCRIEEIRKKHFKLLKNYDPKLLKMRVFKVIILLFPSIISNALLSMTTLFFRNRHIFSLALLLAFSWFRLDLSIVK